MKKIVSIALIFLLSGHCLFRLGILTYFELNREYIAEVLCINKEEPITLCYGKCFLEKNMDLADQSEKAPQNHTKSKIEIPDFVVIDSFDLDSAEGQSINHITPYQSFMESDFILNIFHPPTLG